MGTITKTEPARTSSELSAQTLTSEILDIEIGMHRAVGIPCQDKATLERAHERHVSDLAYFMESWMGGCDAERIGEKTVFGQLSLFYNRGAAYREGCLVMTTAISKKPHVYDCYTSSEENASVLGRILPDKQISAIVAPGGRNQGHIFLAGEEYAFEVTGRGRDATFPRSEILDRYPHVAEVPARDGLLHVAHYYSGIMLSNAGMNKESVAEFDKSITLARDDACVWTKRGEALFAMDRFDESVKSYDVAMTISEETWVARAGKGTALMRMDRKKEALEEIRRITEINPYEPEAWFWKGIALSDIGMRKEAAAAYGKAINLDPKMAYQVNSVLSEMRRKG
jgi:Flp pilus assembly protein TadD